MATEIDILVIGAGPAGLSAARAAAARGLKTLVIDKLSEPGKLDHPCSSVVAPLPGLVRGEWVYGGLCFPELDLCIPQELVSGVPSAHRYVAPGGASFTASFPDRPDFPVVVLDKAGLLRLMAQRAAEQGAELRYDVLATGLEVEDGCIVGACTCRETLRARVVLAAEGLSRQFSEAAGLFTNGARAKRHAFIVYQELAAPAAGAAQVGQLSTLGRRYTTAKTPAFGTLVIPRPGIAEVYFTTFADRAQGHTNGSLWAYLEEYKERDPRVSPLLQGATVLRRSGCRMVLRRAPERVVRDGFLAVGDTVGPTGRVGILPAAFLGKRAAEIAAEALAAGEATAERLEDYNRLFHGSVLRSLEAEARIITALSAMTDAELDRVCETLGKANLAPFFLGERGPMLAELARWASRAGTLLLRDRHLLRRLLQQ